MTRHMSFLFTLTGKFTNSEAHPLQLLNLFSQIFLIEKSPKPHKLIIIISLIKNQNFNIPFGSAPPLSNNPKLTCIKALKRAHSDSNLEGLAPNYSLEEFHQTVNIHTNPMLRSEPSLSIYSSEYGFGEQKEEENVVENDGFLTLEKCVSVTNGDNTGCGDFSFGKNDMGLIEEENNEKELVDLDEGFINGIGKLNIEENDRPLSPPMYLSTGFGMDGNGVGSGGGLGVDFRTSCFDQVEDFYKRLVSEDPSNPLYLRNYAQLLQSKGDLSGAEDLFFRATLADPTDGEILLQYAKLVWELHHDQDRALSYFERAACAAPHDSHLLAAYASFLWEIDGGMYEDIASTNDIQIENKILVELPNSSQEKSVSPPFNLAAGLVKDADASGAHVGDTVYTSIPPSEDVDMENYYKRMVEENSSNPLFHRNYAQFLHQSKGDLRGAEDYYSRAILAEPGDGEVILQYANLVWELYHDHTKALCYFERAVQAAPEDSHILAAYARFLWETDDGDEDSSLQNDIQTQIVHLAKAPASNALVITSS